MSSILSWDGISPGMPTRLPKERPSKGMRDYLRALKRRFWVVVLVTLIVGGAGTALTLHQKPVYWTSSRILIEPPRAIVQGLNDENTNRANAENFFNTRMQMIASRQITERVMQALKLSDWEELNGLADPVAELQGWINVKPVQNSNLVDVGLAASDPNLVAKIVNTTVEEFLRYEQESMQEFDQLSRSRIDSELRGLEGLVSSARQALGDFHKEHQNFLLTGESLEAGRLTVLEEAKARSELRVDAAKRAVEQFEALRAAGIPYLTPLTQQKLAEVKEQVQFYDEELEHQRSVIRPELFDTDIAIKRLKEKRDELAKSLEGLGNEDAQFELERLRQELRFAETDDRHLDNVIAEQRKAVINQQDEQNKLTSLQSEHIRVQSLGDFIARKKLEVELHQGLVTPRIQVVDRAEVPRAPIRPIKEVQIPLFFACGLLLGAFCVLGLEHADQSIRVPDDALSTLDWPLLAVLPRFHRRDLREYRGRVPIASEQAGSIAREAFRNLRSGILGAESSGHPFRSLLVTSASAKEGKSTIAVNLAATCARAGESVLLLDIDLRQSALHGYFGTPPCAVGLVDVLQGEMPWQKAILPTEIPNLSLLPAGDAEAVPLDILGTVEMFDLLREASEKFDRVILDASPLLGLADARVVGRFADGVVFVVQAGSPDRRPLLRARQLFDQQGLRPVGIVFNGIAGNHEDLADLDLLTTRTTASRPIHRAAETRRAA
ncbi:MAG: polysaccharide biosynthesis tyrosine autokinase [Planctomycetota bacterium]